MGNRLPTPGSDNGTWGNILNSFLGVSHKSDGTLANNTVGTNQIQSGAVTNTHLDGSTQIKLTTASTAVQNVNGKTGPNITLAAADISAVAASQLGTASGVATLNSSSQLTSNQLPSSVAVGSQKAVPGTILCIGESIEYINGDAWPLSGTPPLGSFAQPDGIVTWACAFSDGRLRFVKNCGQSGASSAQVLANIQNPSSQQYALAQNPAPGIIIIGACCGDDPGVLTAAQGLANTLAIANLMIANYPTSLVVLCTVPGVNIPNGGNAAYRQVWNPGIRAFAAANPVLLFDFEALYINPLTGLPVTAYSNDQIHPNPTGGMVLGRALWNLLAPYAPQGNGFINDYSNDTRVSVANGGWTVDAMMQGTLGAGNTATNWNIVGPAGFTKSLIARSDQYGNWQKVSLGGTAGEIGIYRFYGALPAGAVVQPECELLFYGDWNSSIDEISLWLTTSNIGGSAQCLGAHGQGSTYGNYQDPGAGTVLGLRAPPITVPAGGSAGGFFGVDINGSATTGSFAIGRASLIRLA